MKYKLIPKNKNFFETTSSLANPLSYPINELTSEEDDSDLMESESLSFGDEDIDKFNSPKDAIRWCNEKFKELNDIKYKQIANYLHIYM